MKIVTAVVNNPLFIIIQYYTLKKYFKGASYEFIVFNDAKDFPDFTNNNETKIKAIIKSVCKKLGVLCIDIPNSHHRKMKEPSFRTDDAMNYILKYQIRNPDKYLLLDSDMFLIDYFDINKWSAYDCSVVLQSRTHGTNGNQINYFWNGIYYFDMTKMKNTELLNWRCSPYCDTGGMTQVWLEKTKKEKPESINYMRCLTGGWNIDDLPDNLKSKKRLIDFIKNDCRNKNADDGGSIFSEIYEDVFFHYRSGGNWRVEGMKFHESNSKKLQDILLS